MNMRPILFLLFSFFVSFLQAQSFDFADNKRKIDSAIKALEKFKQKDSARLSNIINIFNLARFKKEKELVMPYLEEARILSKQTNSTYGMANCLFFTAGYHRSTSNYSNAIVYFDSVIQFAGNSENKILIKVKYKAFHEKGLIYKIQGKLYQAINNFIESLNICKNQDTIYLQKNYKFIAESFVALKNRRQAIKYINLAIQLCKVRMDTSEYIGNSIDLAQIYLNENNADSAKFILHGLPSYLNDKTASTIMYAYYKQMGTVKYLVSEFDSASVFFEKSLLFLNDGLHIDMKSGVLASYALSEIKRNNLVKAKNIIDELSASALSIDKKDRIVLSYECLAQYYKKLGNFQLANEFLEKELILNDSIYELENLKLANLSADLFESENKEKEIRQLAIEKNQNELKLKQQGLINKALIGSTFGVSLLGFLGFRNFRGRQKLQQAKITELEKDKQLMAVDAMLRGQEEERSRIAKDLHDGLGGMLSGTKLSFMNVKENLIMTQENASLFDRSLSMLDNTISDLRKVAQNLMPEALVKFGLDEALKDYCQNVTASSNLEVEYQYLGEKRKLSNTAEVFIYRIIQELVNNALKHAHAKNLLVQLTMQANLVTITVEDDGVGIDKKLLEKNKGAGMDNVLYRVDYFKGNLDMVSNPNQGTSIHIELHV
jgi:two-component system, NarL family, sensor kinase